MQMQNGLLASSYSLSIGISYLLLQCFLILFSITNSFKLMTYHLKFMDVDISSIVQPDKLWEIVMIHQNSMQQRLQQSEIEDSVVQPTPFGRRQLYPDNDNELQQILEQYVTQKQPAIHLYSGMWDARFILHAEIQNLLRKNIIQSFPWTFDIESIDSFVLIYSLLLVCFAVLFHSLKQKLNNPYHECPQSENGEMILSGDILLFDTLFWLIMTMYFFILTDVSNVISIPIFSFWQSLLYVSLVYVISTPSNIPKHNRLLILGVLLFSVLIQTTSSHPSMSTGGILIISNVSILAFLYISVVEKCDMAKFLNIRLWCMVFLNFLFLIFYFDNVGWMTESM